LVDVDAGSGGWSTDGLSMIHLTLNDLMFMFGVGSGHRHDLLLRTSVRAAGDELHFRGWATFTDSLLSLNPYIFHTLRFDVALAIRALDWQMYFVGVNQVIQVTTEASS
jgi:hypothetical protein